MKDVKRLSEREWCLWWIITLRARGKKKMLSFRIRSRLNVPPTSSQIMSEYSIHGALGRLRNRPGETRLSGIFFTLHRETFASLIARKHFDSSRLFPLALFVSLVDAWRDFHISNLLFFVGEWALQHYRPLLPLSRAKSYENFFKSSFGELTKFVRNCVSKFSFKPGKRILI